jgi:centrosomal protein CEP104
MLANCIACTQIIEVSTYNFHKVYECEKKQDFKQCRRCKEAVEVDFYEQHITAFDCQKSTDQLRCPLCHKDIPAVLDDNGERNDEKSW